jgi:hypothetical protein
MNLLQAYGAGDSFIAFSVLNVNVIGAAWSGKSHKAITGTVCLGTVKSILVSAIITGHSCGSCESGSFQHG